MHRSAWRLTALVFSAGLTLTVLASAGGAGAQDYDGPDDRDRREQMVEAEPDVLPRRVASIMARQGYRLVGPIRGRGDRIVATGVDARGWMARFVIDPEEGEVLRSWPLEPAYEQGPAGETPLPSEPRAPPGAIALPYGDRPYARDVPLEPRGRAEPPGPGDYEPQGRRALIDPYGPGAAAAAPRDPGPYAAIPPVERRSLPPIAADPYGAPARLLPPERRMPAEVVVPPAPIPRSAHPAGEFVAPSRPKNTRIEAAAVQPARESARRIAPETAAPRPPKTARRTVARNMRDAAPAAPSPAPARAPPSRPAARPEADPAAGAPAKAQTAPASLTRAKAEAAPSGPAPTRPARADERAAPAPAPAEKVGASGASNEAAPKSNIGR